MHQLKALFENSVLNEDTKTALKEAFDAAVEARRIELEAGYVEKLEESRKEIMDTLPTIVESAINEELAAVAEEVANARTLEVSYAEKLKTFKENYDQKMTERLEVMVAESVTEELDELKEDIEFAKKNQFGVHMFEAFRDVYENSFGVTEVDIHAKLDEALSEVESYRRKEKMEEVLEGVIGEKRLVAETILEGVSSNKIEAKFNSIKDILLSESTKDDVKEADEEEDKDAVKVSESKKKKMKESDEEADKDKDLKKSTVVKGDVKLDESLSSEAQKNNPWLDKLARTVQVATSKR